MKERLQGRHIDWKADIMSKIYFCFWKLAIKFVWNAINSLAIDFKFFTLSKAYGYLRVNNIRDIFKPLNSCKYLHTEYLK